MPASVEAYMDDPMLTLFVRNEGYEPNLAEAARFHASPRTSIVNAETSDRIDARRGTHFDPVGAA
ncbi:hypothetical protein AEGHOMDF_5061 [Methylobacterium soli]|nr:hypothetical protein AEGHOMDF_5061 [Methylobacterium soli]